METRLGLAFETLYSEMENVKSYLVSGKPQTDILNHYAAWTDTILETLMVAIPTAQDDPDCEWDEYAACIWAAYDVADLRQALEYVMGELPF